MGTVDSFNALLSAHGSSVVFHRDGSVTPCPCLTPEGFRDPEWHDANPLAPVCNESGFLSDSGTTVNITVKALVQPIQSTRATRLTIEYALALFGEIQADDHLGIFPEAWASTSLNFYDWSQTGSDYITYNGRRFNVVNANLIPDPDDGNPRHHWECGLRLISDTPPI